MKNAPPNRILKVLHIWVASERSVCPDASHETQVCLLGLIERCLKCHEKDKRRQKLHETSLKLYSQSTEIVCVSANDTVQR